MTPHILLLAALSSGQVQPQNEFDASVLAEEYRQYIGCVHDSAAKFTKGNQSTATEIAIAALDECRGLGESARERARQRVAAFNKSSAPAQQVPLKWVDETYEQVVARAKSGAVAGVVKMRAK